MVPQKWSHATIKNRNGVYGNKDHVKQWFKKWKNLPKTITLHALRKDGFWPFIKMFVLHGILFVFLAVGKSIFSPM